MELYQEMIAGILLKRIVEIILPELKLKRKELIEMEAYQALEKIKVVLEDDSLNDPECFTKIEEIVCLLEGLGSSGGSRHDL